MHLLELIFDAMAWFENTTFDAAFFSMTTGHGFGLVGIITAIVMVSYFHYQIAMRCFGLITHMPDRVSRWFGASADGNHEDHGHTQAAVGMFYRAVEGKAGGLASSLAGRGAGRPGPAPKGKEFGKEPNGKPGAPPSDGDDKGGKLAGV